MEAVVMQYAVVLAAGQGTRMQSSRNKVMHELLGKPVIAHVVDKLSALALDQVVLVTGYGREEVEEYFGDRVLYAYQDEQMGTGDAVSKVQQLQGKEGETLLVYGDCALISKETFAKVFEEHKGYDLTILTAKTLGESTKNRVIRDNQGFVSGVVEYQDIRDEDKELYQEVDLGLYCFDNKLLFEYLPELHDSSSREKIHIADLVKVMREKGHKIQALRVDNEGEFMGINDRFDLGKAHKYLQKQINAKHLSQGVSILEPESVYIGPDVKIEKDVKIYPNVHIYGQSHIGEGAHILSGSWLEDVSIGAHTQIDSSKIVGGSVGDHSTVGPMAHLRSNCVIGHHVRIGNFVEMKNVHFGNYSASAHLTYLGDAKVGQKVNIGCGVVTANYDGKKKHQTVIEDEVFVGSNSTLIAPVTIGEKTVVAAGSTITEDVDREMLAIARSRQTNKKWKKEGSNHER